MTYVGERWTLQMMIKMLVGEVNWKEIHRNITPVATEIMGDIMSYARLSMHPTSSRAVHQT